MGREKQTDREQDGEALKNAALEWKPSRQELMIMLTLAIVSFMVSLDATVIVTSLSTIVQALDATATQGFWVGTSYLLTCAVTMPFTASLSDILGRPRCLFASVLCFLVGTILCAVAHGIGLLLIGRCVQGVGGGGIIIVSLVIFTDIVPLRFRPKYVGIIQGAWALGTCIGPLIGGALATLSHWRGIFYIMFPLCGLGLVLVPFFVRLRPCDATWREMMCRVDWVGGFLFISSATGLLIAISWGGTQEPWSSFRTIVPLAFGALGLVGTVFWECFGAREPFLRHSLFRHRSAFAVYAGSFFQGLLLYGQLYYISFFLESVKLDSPIRTGVSLLPVMLTLIPTAVVVGATITRTGSFRWAIWTGWGLATLATGVTISWSRHTGTGGWVVVLIVLGVGHGLLLNALNCASQAVSLPGDEGAAAAMYAFLRSFGMAVGVGVGGSIFQNVMQAKLSALHLPPSIAANAEAYLAVLREMGHDRESLGQRDAVIAAYTAGFRGVFGFFCALGGLSLVLACLIRHFEINKELTTEHTVDESMRMSWRSRFSQRLDRQNQGQGHDQDQVSRPESAVDGSEVPS